MKIVVGKFQKCEEKHYGRIYPKLDFSEKSIKHYDTILPKYGKIEGKQEFWTELKNNQRFNASWSEDCHVYPECYLYGGTGKNSRTTMITFIIYKK